MHKEFSGVRISINSNMAYTTINDPSQYFDTLLWAGNGNSPRTETGLNFQPDWIWHKNRTDSGRSHYVHDSSRGFGAHKELTPNNNHTENSDSHLTETAGYINAATSTGFTIGAGSSSQNYTNRAGANYVAWCWKANGATTSSDSNGDQTSTVQANTTAGFSIATFAASSSAGQTVGHGLGSAPDMYIWKSREREDNWYIYHRSLGAGGYLRLNTTDAFTSNTNVWSNTDPSSTVIYYGGNSLTNNNEDHILYSFKSIQGYSKFGKYIGNGAQNGTFVYTGFRPAWIMIKRTDTTKNWYIADSTRSPTNIPKAFLVSNTNDVEDTSGDASDAYFDILSNGFKLRQDFSHLNADGGTHIYMAFAESPFVTSNGTPNNAR